MTIPTNNQPAATQSKPNESGSVSIQGHIKIFDPVTKEVIIDKRNAIHYENFSIAFDLNLCIICFLHLSHFVI